MLSSDEYAPMPPSAADEQSTARVNDIIDAFDGAQKAANFTAAEFGGDRQGRNAQG